MPQHDLPFPQQRTVKRVARDQPPFRRRENGCPRGLVKNVEQASVRGHNRAHARHVVMLPRVARPADPLVPVRRLDHAVVRHGVITGIVQVMRPLIYLIRPRFHFLRPLASRSSVNHAVGRQDTHHLVL